jgi:hypothetical protein
MKDLSDGFSRKSRCRARGRLFVPFTVTMSISRPSTATQRRRRPQRRPYRTCRTSARPMSARRRVRR